MTAAEATFDVVVVGAGSAGCALVDQLSADGRLSVLVLEAGGSDRRFWIKTPIGYGVCFHDPSVNWRFRTEPDPGLGGRRDYWPRGKVLGGSSSINALVYCRGLPEDYEDWRAAGNPGWGWDEAATAFRALETRAGDPTSGALSVEDRSADHHPIRTKFFAAARDLGLPETTDMNGSEPEGVAPYAITTRNGLRCSAADAFLRPAMRRANVAVATGAQAARILFEDRRAVGVAYRRGGRPCVAHARAAVVLSAGAIGTPQLLQISGVGPAERLARIGVEPIMALDAVGGGLQDHLGMSYLHRATTPTLNQVFGRLSGRLSAGLRFLAFRDGPLSLSVNQSGGLVRSRPDAPRPDIQLYFSPLSYSTIHDDKRPLMKPDRHPGFALGFNACRPTSRGRVDAASADPRVAPAIRPAYLSTQRDVSDAIAGARLIGRLQETQALRAVTAGAPVHAVATMTDDAVLEDIRRRSGSVYHPCGTCRMAPADQGGVVDVRLRVYGVDGLRVADASIFPNITSANTNAPSIMVGRRAGALIREDLL